MRDASHRTWPPPSRPWIMRQRWEHVLFAHWSFPREDVADLLPHGVSLDTFRGRAWIGVVPFRMRGVRLRLSPPVPGASAFPELNVRTYVTVGDRPGVWFFSLDAASALAVAVARRWFHLPYYRARMACEDGTRKEHHGPIGRLVDYRSRRTHAGAPPADFAARYGPAGPVQTIGADGLEHFLTERYCLYAARPDGRLLRGHVHHAPWPLQPARADVAANSMLAPLGLELPEAPPLLHYAAGLDVVAWSPRPV